MAKGKIVRVTFTDRIMLFGNSYKPWKMQFDEYVWLCKRDGEELKLVKVEVSDSNWVSWGGLKWCPEDKFQHQLNREGCQSDESDNPKPRQYNEMKFYVDKKITKDVNSLLAINLQGGY